MALSSAASSGKEEVIKYLLTRDDINAFAYCKDENRCPLILAGSSNHLKVCKMLAAEMKRYDEDRYDDTVKWIIGRSSCPSDLDFEVNKSEMIEVLHVLGYADLAEHCRALDPMQAPLALRLWSPYTSCSLCGVSDLVKCWCCLVHQQEICHGCVGSGFWCLDGGHVLSEISANWYSEFPRFTGLRRSFDVRIAKKMEYWQGLTLCNICGENASDGYHCRKCFDDHFDICDGCLAADRWSWCSSFEHSLKRNPSTVQRQNRPPWIVSYPKAGVNLGGTWVRNRFATGRRECDLCAEQLKHGYFCAVCDTITRICWKCHKERRWCEDATHLLQEYDDTNGDAISYPWRSYKEIKSPRRKSFDAQCRIPCQKPAQNRRYSFSDASDFACGERYLHRWARRLRRWRPQVQDCNIILDDDQTSASKGSKRRRPLWEKWWPGGNFANAYYESRRAEGRSQK